MKTTSKILALLLLGAPAIGFAQSSCKATEACLSWVAPTQFVTNAPFPAGVPITYRVYLGTEAREAMLLGTTTQRTMKLTTLPPGEQCFVVTAVVNNNESVVSNSACKLIRFAGPTEGAIEAPTDGAIED